MLGALNLSPVEREFLGFCVGQCRNNPGNVVTGWAARDDEITRTKVRLKPILGKISHWKVTRQDYKAIKSEVPATWFIDPPYQHRKSDYVIKLPPDFYPKLTNYCNSVPGQVIVCEGQGADWLDFELLKSVAGQRRQSIEMVKLLHN